MTKAKKGKKQTPVDTNSRIVLTSAAVGLGFGMVGAMAWSAAAVPAAQPANTASTEGAIVVAEGSTTGLTVQPVSRAQVPAMPAPASRSRAQAKQITQVRQAPVARSQGS